MSESDRQYDLVVWGATGVAGRLVAEYLAGRYSPGELSLALGGRNESRLRDVESELVAESDWEEIPLVLGDATDPETLGDLARNTRVVCTTVGPYTRYGSPLVEACIEAGTDYCDLTGEINWIRETVDRYHDEAVAAETRIVHSCGFDSVPADLGTLLVQSFAREEFGAPCDLARIYVEDTRGGVSGGTLASFGELFEAASEDPIVRQTLRNPYSLAPPGERDGVDPGAQRLPRRDRLRGAWTAPSPMAPVNERIVRRSNALLGYPYGREFRCSEAVTTGPGLGGAAIASTAAAGFGLFAAGMAIDPVREGLQRFVFPDPGEGPSDRQIENGRFTVRVRGRGTGPDGQFTVESVIGAERDPGYGATARMLGEAGMCLVRGETESPLDGGILTPASGIGDPLADRLRDAGFTVSVEETAE
ncbi:oxidoreductase [Halovenus sp. WSH3]|uniref:Oxidoreductase n=1 Tax=Halovenus carboxidivorans TaxID=2692199 RepID=A0A6B0T2D7_9EURY|nr:saccharopine dehydrogenase NADP-binding domain-containing protein [Halovenus carboxidivorans]MXR50396.1 oxidoreductase [Halovenus carboxidivorans]